MEACDKREHEREERPWGKGLGFWSGVAWESNQVLGFSIWLGYWLSNICCPILSVHLNHWIKVFVLSKDVDRCEDENIWWWHGLLMRVRCCMCVFWFTLLEDRSTSWLVEIGFETMKLRAIKSHIFFASVHQIKQFQGQQVCIDLFYHPSLDPRSNQGLVRSHGLSEFCNVLRPALSTLLELEKLWGEAECKPSFSKALIWGFRLPIYSWPFY
jgi:hypothetical protein